MANAEQPIRDKIGVVRSRPLRAVAFRYHLLFHPPPFHNRPHRGRVQMRVSVMEMVLLDWTRMGRSFCVAGAAFPDTHYRLVRPLWANTGQAPVGRVRSTASRLERPVGWDIL